MTAKTRENKARKSEVQNARGTESKIRNRQAERTQKQLSDQKTPLTKQAVVQETVLQLKKKTPKPPQTVGGMNITHVNPASTHQCG